MIRQPIVSVLGHVDHGKTSLLDKVRGSTVAAREAGRITQHIGATEVPMDTIRGICGPLMKGREFKIPGLLFIDTPGHHAFSSLRARGGALADIAILVVDVNEGFQPQTEEALSILRRNKTPFVVAANKVDMIPGWDSTPDAPIVKGISAQSEKVQRRLDEGVYELVGKIHDISGRPSDRYDRVQDFTKSIAIVPVSALTGEGLPDLLLMLVGLAQRFLEQQLEADITGHGQGTILEVKEERGLGLTLDAIVYNGQLRQGDTLVIATTGEPRVTRVKALLKPRPLDEIRDPSDRFESVEDVHAATGLKIAAPDLDGVLAGSPFRVADEDTLEAVKAELKEEFQLHIEYDEEGVLVKADTLGSLEALASELKDRDIPIHRAEVGDVSRRDVVEASTVNAPTRRAILAFNVKALPDARDALQQADDTALFEDEVIYNLLDLYEEWVDKRKRELERDRRGELVHPGKFEILPDHTFRVSKPAIVGVRVLAGRVRVGQRLLREDGRVVGLIKSIRTGEESIREAKAGDEVAIAVDGVTVGRQLDENEVYYIDIPEGDARTLLRGDTLNADERDVLEQVAAVKRREENFWGM